MQGRSRGAGLGGEVRPRGGGWPVLLAECGELVVCGAGAGAGDAVKAPGWAAFGMGVDVFFAADEPAGVLDLGEVWVEGAAGLAGEAHEFESVAWLLGVFEEDLDDCGHLGRESEGVDRRFHAPQCSTTYIG